MIYEITVIEIVEEFVRYRFTTGETGITGRKWFPNVEVGQLWKMICVGAVIISCSRIR